MAQPQPQRTRAGGRPALVSLVGAGPGDPELLTLKAVRRLEEADVVVYDRLISAAVLDLVPSGAARLYVGKAAAQHHMPQAAINDLLVKLSRAGHRVVRLKGGDPFVFGRGSEEALYLADHGIPFEVVPGITAAAGVGAAVGIPLTHRDLARGVRFITGHCREDTTLELDWVGLADPETTLVVYMGLANLRQITARLIDAGLSGDTPAAAVTRGTAGGQRQCLTTLARLPGAVAAAGLKAPVLFIIGRVVELATRLNWQGLVWDDRRFAAHGVEEKIAHG